MTEINSLIGVPFLDRGRTEAGADCWGIVVLAFRRMFSIDLPTFDDYPGLESRTRDDLARMIHDRTFAWDEVERGLERRGDVVLLAIGRQPCHVGIVTEPGRMLTTSRGDAARIESYRGIKWRSRVYGFFRHRQTYF